MFRHLGTLLLLGVTSRAALAGAIGGISPGESLAPGTVRTVLLPGGGLPGSGTSEMELVLSLDGGATFPLRVSSEVPGDEALLVFRVPNLPTPAARLALRVGRDGRSERVEAVSEPFSIAPSREAPLETLRAVRGEAATRDVAGSTPVPPVPPGLSDERRDLLDAAPDDAGVEDDSAPASIPPDLPLTDLSPGAIVAAGELRRTFLSRMPLQVPKRE